MNAPFASITKTWHNTSYPAISPTRPELSAKGKSVFITGGGTGIGAAVVYSFARAGAREFALAGRTQATLSETALRLKTDFPDVKVLTLITDVTKQDTVDAAFETTMKVFGKIDICISNAGYSAPPAPIASISEKEWQTAFDINVNGSLYIIKAFLRYAKEGACLFNTSSGIGHMPTIPNISSYVASKAAGIRIFESVATENPGFFVVNVQPGVVVTAASKMGNGGAALDVDDGESFVLDLLFDVSSN